MIKKTITHFKTKWLDLSFSRRLTNEEKKQLIRDPYCLFKPLKGKRKK